jgi:type I restriction enzyme S subunit
MSNSDWPRVTIGELIASGAILAHKDGNYGSLYPRVEEFGSEGVPFLTAKSLDAGEIDIDGAPRLADERADALRFGFVQPNDVLLSHNATIGRVAVVPQFDGRLLVGTSLTYFRLNLRHLLPRYFAAYLAGTDFQDQLVAVMSHSTRNQVPITAQRALSVVVPPLDAQQMIADVLGSLDDKIEQNRRTGQALERLARATFKAWFVDFEPVKAKAAGQTSFPGMTPTTFAALPNRFVDSELGPVPQDWEVGKIRDLCERVENGGTPKRNIDDYWSPAEVPWLTSGEVRQSFVMRTANFISKSGLENSSSKLWPQFTTVVALYGATAGIATMLGVEVCANQACCGLVPRIGKCFVHQVLAGALVELQQRARGSAQQNLSQSIVADFECVMPSDAVLRDFENSVLPLYELCMHLEDESSKLATLRDYLLPRLLSGRVRVRSNDAIVEDIA